HHLHQAGRLAVARGRCPGSGRRQAEGDGPREGRGHRPARRPGYERVRQVMIRKELWFGFALMGMILLAVLVFSPWSNLTDAHLSREDMGFLALLMLALVVVTIMLGFPTAFTLMGMGVFFAWLAYRNVDPALANRQ